MNKPSRTEKSKAILASVEETVQPPVRALLENGLVPALVKQYLTANAIAGEITGSNHERSRKKQKVRTPDVDGQIKKSKRS
jgi:hypothetical protein